jgi:ribosomal protein S18 acetylase RimI-like enzyme
MIIERVTTVSDELIAAFARLIPQLTDHPAPDREMIQRLIDSRSSIVLIARADDPPRSIAGALTLILYLVPTGVRARIEDVVVDESARGQGIGSALVVSAIDLAKAAGAESIGLSSNPARQAANHLYQKLGFQKWDSNHYRYWIGKQA